jgi:hypothetical protein
MTRLMKKVTYNGALWCTVEDASHYLKTNTTKVKALMMAGKLAYTQIRANGRIYVSLSDLVKVQTERLYPSKE